MASILLKEKIHEALASVVPITLIVLALSFSLAPLPLNIMALFIGGAVLLILGMGRKICCDCLGRKHFPFLSRNLFGSRVK